MGSLFEDIQNWWIGVKADRRGRGHEWLINLALDVGERRAAKDPDFCDEYIPQDPLVAGEIGEIVSGDGIQIGYDGTPYRLSEEQKERITQHMEETFEAIDISCESQVRAYNAVEGQDLAADREAAFRGQ